MLSNAYVLAKFRFDTAENEPAKNLQNFANFANFAPMPKEGDAGLLRIRHHGRRIAPEALGTRATPDSARHTRFRAISEFRISGSFSYRMKARRRGVGERGMILKSDVLNWPIYCN